MQSDIPKNQDHPVTDVTRRYRRHVQVLIFGLAAYVALAAGVNLWIDPWEIWRPLSASDRPHTMNNERISLANDIRNSDKFEALLLGSSRVRYLFDKGDSRHTQIDLTRPFFGEKRAFDAALAGANIHHMRRVFEHALRYHPVSDLVLLLDDVMMNTYRPLGNGWNEANYYGSSNYLTGLERVLSLADFSMLKSSTNILRARIETPAKDANMKVLGIPEVWKNDTEEFSRRDLYGCYEIGPSSRDDLDRLLTLAKQHNVRVTIIASFIHPVLFEYFYRSDKGAGLRLFMSAVGELAIRHDVPAWYFSPFTSITSGTPRIGYSNPEFFDRPDFYDPGHANYLIGKRLLEWTLKGVRHDDMQGYRLDKSSPDEILSSIEPGRTLRIQNNDIQFLDFIVSNPLIAGHACPAR